jgi:hypothetical protein
MVIAIFEGDERCKYLYVHIYTKIFFIALLLMILLGSAKQVMLKRRCLC